MDNFIESLERAAKLTIERLLEFLPNLLGAIALLLAGWLLARVLRMAARRGAALIDSLLARVVGEERWHIGRSASVLGAVIYWIVMLFFVTAATHTLGLQTFTDWLEQLLAYLPTLAAGLLIVVAGYVLSGFVAELVKATVTGLAVNQRDALARMAQGATLALALLVGADQIGLKVTWIAIFAAVLAATLIGGVALAVSIGSRGYVSNLIGAHYLKQALHIGQHVRVAGFEGHIVEVTATSLVLDTDSGRVVLPGRVYHDEAIVLITRQDNL